MGDAIMVVDDDPQVLRLLGTILEKQGARVVLESNPRRGLEKLKSSPVDVLFSDLRMPGCDGLELVREARTMHPRLAAIIMSGYGSLNSSISAFRLGAVDFLTKPFDSRQVANALERASAHAAYRNPPAPPNSSVSEQAAVALITASPAMKRVLALIRRVAAAPVPVLVIGDSGVGKEVIARSIHAMSAQSNGPFVTVNCQALSETQLLDCFFGHERTSRDHCNSVEIGAIERAAGGMLFLRNVVLLPKWMQAELLHTMQSGKFVRQGGQRAIRVATRIAASAAHDLRQDVQQGTLLDDLYFHLNVVPIQVPPLRDRREDLRSLVQSILQEPICVEVLRERRQPLTFADDAIAMLERYDWPGNLFELKNFVHRAIVFASAPEVTATVIAELLPPPRSARSVETITVPFRGDLRVIERAIVTEVIHRSHGNKSAAARALGLHRKSLYRIIEGQDFELTGE